MKYLKRSILLAVTLSSIAHAAEVCYSFDVSNHSDGIEQILVSMPAEKKLPAKFSAKIAAEKSAKRAVLTELDCTKHHAKISCSQADGAGDFVFEDVKGTPTLTLSYLNLLIGSKGLVRAEPKTEIDEEFAIYSSKDGDDSDVDEDSGELEEFALMGKTVPCK